MGVKDSYPASSLQVQEKGEYDKSVVSQGPLKRQQPPLMFLWVIFPPWLEQFLLPGMPFPLSKSYTSTKTELRFSLLPSLSLWFLLLSWPKAAGLKHTCLVLCGFGLFHWLVQGELVSCILK